MSSKKIIIDKLKFFADCEYQPHPGQLSVHNSGAKRRVVACGVRWGKTTCAAMEGLAAALAPSQRSVGWIVAPNYELANRTFSMIAQVASTYFPKLIHTYRESDGILLLHNLGGGLSEIRSKSAESPDSLLGEGLDWVVVDEASRLKPSIWVRHLSQRLMDKNGWALLISTPKGKGYFYELWCRARGGEADWESWNGPSWQNPIMSPEKIATEKRLIPEHVFQQEYAAEFIEGDGSVFRYVRECATGAWSDGVKGKPYYAGLDLARVRDYTVLSILDSQCNLVHVDRYRGLDWGLQLDRIKATLDRYNKPKVYVDSTGAGQPMCELLRTANVNVVPYNFTSNSKDALIRNLSLKFEQKKIVIPGSKLWPEGIDELEAYQYSVTETGKTTSGASGTAHDDIVISLALAAWPLRKTPQPIASCPPRVYYYDEENDEMYHV